MGVKTTVYRPGFDDEVPVEIDPRLLEILVCPACHGVIEPRPGQGLECLDCGRIYPVRDGIPVMLVDEASPPTRGTSPP